uniref:Rap associating with DIL domain n=1 Tax=Apteryx owenii TaxID=8824 RepID=A0A8B9QPW9_APTOW
SDARVGVTPPRRWLSPTGAVGSGARMRSRAPGRNPPNAAQRPSASSFPTAGSDDPAELSTQLSAPGVLKIFGGNICAGTNYKSVLATGSSGARELVKEALERYGLSQVNAGQYVLCDVIGRFEGSEKQWQTEGLRVLGDTEKPLLIQDLWKPREGFSRRLELRKRAEVEELASRDVDTTTAGQSRARALPVPVPGEGQGAAHTAVPEPSPPCSMVGSESSAGADGSLPGRRKPQLEFERAAEDALLGRILSLVEPAGDDRKLTPAFLLCLCIQHSAAAFEPGDFGQLLLKAAKMIQRTVRVSPWAVCPPPQGPGAGSFRRSVLAGRSWGKKSVPLQVSSSSCLPVQCLYASLPALLECNPFQNEGRETWRTSPALPEELRRVVLIYQDVLDLLRQYEVHPEITSQMFAYLFFFSNTLLFNQLLDKGSSLGCFHWSKGVKLRACVRLLLEWLRGAGFEQPAQQFFAKLASVADLLAVPGSQLLQVSGCRCPPGRRYGFRVDLEVETLDDDIYRHLLYVRHFLWSLQSKSPHGGGGGDLPGPAPAKVAPALAPRGCPLPGGLQDLRGPSASRPRRSHCARCGGLDRGRAASAAWCPRVPPARRRCKGSAPLIPPPPPPGAGEVSGKDGPIPAASLAGRDVREAAFPVLPALPGRRQAPRNRLRPPGLLVARQALAKASINVLKALGGRDVLRGQRVIAVRLQLPGRGNVLPTSPIPSPLPARSCRPQHPQAPPAPPRHPGACRPALGHTGSPAPPVTPLTRSCWGAPRSAGTSLARVPSWLATYPQPGPGSATAALELCWEPRTSPSGVLAAQASDGAEHCAKRPGSADSLPRRGGRWRADTMREATARAHTEHFSPSKERSTHHARCPRGA